MLSIKTVSGLAHYTDWIIGHVHSGAMGWVGMITMGSLYYMIPRLWGQTRMWSVRLIDWHFWTATIGVVLYIASMWVAGVTEGLMWRAMQPDGTLTYSFIESIVAVKPLYYIRLLGGVIYLFGMCLMVYNSWRTIRQGQAVDAPIPQLAGAHAG